MDVDHYLEKLNNLIDAKHVVQAEKLQVTSMNYEQISRLPLIVGSLDDMSKTRYPLTDWPIFNYGEIYNNPEKMLLDELSTVYEGTLIRDDRVYVIRANCGIGVIPSLFGCQIIQEGDNMPWVKPLESLKSIRKLINRGVPDFKKGLGSKIIEIEEYFKETINKYENLKRLVHIGIADNQGPLNLATSIMGENIFLALYDHLQLIHDLLELLTETYIGFTRAQKNVVGEDVGEGYYFQCRLKGGVRIAEDHGLSISPQMYGEFCVPYNSRISESFNGATVLICGKASHVINNILNTTGIKGLIYWSQNFQDLVEVYRRAKSREIPIMWYGAIPSQHRADFPTGLILKEQVRSMEEARRTLIDHTKGVKPEMLA